MHARVYTDPLSLAPDSILLLCYYCLRLLTTLQSLASSSSSAPPPRCIFTTFVFLDFWRRKNDTQREVEAMSESQKAGPDKQPHTTHNSQSVSQMIPPLTLCLSV